MPTALDLLQLLAASSRFPDGVHAPMAADISRMMSASPRDRVTLANTSG